ncbi:MAG: S1 RNA-binding domain-containing protein, partial [Oscillospiraceae bacterium]|nr:S1 RNA-binding domain-containing protein [Oscillospiraceae bacterium]
ILSIGDEIDVYVISFDREKRKISLGYKNKGENPWITFTNTYDIGSVANVKIVKLMPFGAFAEIIPGVDGLIHISQLSDHRIGKPDEVVEVGQEVDVKIIDIDNEKQKVSLSIRALLQKPRVEPQAEPDETVYDTENAPAEEPVEAPSEEPAEAPAEIPAEAPAEAPAEEPAEAPAEETAEAPAEE